MKRFLVVLILAVGLLGGIWIGSARPARAATIPAVCIHHATSVGSLEVGYCPNG
jgi:hypothetical protein